MTSKTFVLLSFNLSITIYILVEDTFCLLFIKTWLFNADGCTRFDVWEIASTLCFIHNKIYLKFAHYFYFLIYLQHLLI